jgi:hypothetical protein
MRYQQSNVQSIRSGPASREAGVALFYALFAVLVAGSMLAVSMASAGIAHRNSRVKRFDTQAQYLAEGAVETAKKQVQLSIANWGAVPPSGTAMVGDTPVDYAIAPTGFAAIRTDASGIETVVTGYEIDATAGQNGARSSAHRVMNALATPLFQYAVFYDSDLEIMPGPDMTIRGRVHTNRNMYLASNATLTLNTNYLHAAGDIYRNRKDDPSQSPGTVRVRNWVANPFDASEPLQYTQMNSRSQMAALGVPSTSGYDSRFLNGYDANGNGDFSESGDWLPFGPGALAYWAQPAGYGESGNTVMTEEHGVTESVVPSVGSTAMYEPNPNGDYDWNPLLQRYVQVASGTGSFSPGYYHAEAGLSILTNADGTWKAYNATGNDVSAALSGAVSIKQMYDARQASGSSTKIKVTQVDMAKLALTGLYPANGLLYVANYSEGTGLNAKGVRLVNGGTLANKLTVVTPDPLYIMGNYNTTAEKPAAVICDAINLLSNAWNDTKTKGTLPAATNTTYNVAVVTGNTETVGSNYNGGLENLPRFHENWDGKTSTIKGSFVKPWFSQYGTGGWVYGGDRYTAPVRNWSYNPAFNNVANLPPFTPMAVTAQDIVSW